MFVGHYGPAFATRLARRPPSLGAAFIAVQLVDYGWAALILAGIERAHIEPGFLALSHLSLDHMPWTHSLPGALAWSLGGALVYRLLDRRGGWIPTILIGVCVFSHWLLDLLVHAPDLPLWFGGPKVGFGWWGVPTLGITAEAVALLGGFIIYMKTTTPLGVAGRFLPWVLLALFLALYLFDKVAPPSPDIRAQAMLALAAYSLIAAVGFVLDRTRALNARLQAKP